MTKIDRHRSKIDIEPVSLQSADAQHCLDHYYAELAARFEDGFDHRQGGVDADASMAPPDGAFIIARLEGEPVGCGGFKRLDVHTAEVKRVWCSPNARGIGVATALMDRLERLARDAGYMVLRLDINRALTEAHALYRKLGYRAIERYNDNPYSDHWFEKVLRQSPWEPSLPGRLSRPRP